MRPSVRWVIENRWRIHSMSSRNLIINFGGAVLASLERDLGNEFLWQVENDVNNGSQNMIQTRTFAPADIESPQFYVRIHRR